MYTFAATFFVWGLLFGMMTARQQLQRAYDLRKDAHALDPEHTAAAWTVDQQATPTGRDTHSDLMTFYRSHLEPKGADDDRSPRAAAEAAAEQPESAAGAPDRPA
jgi:hypothetical protein